MKLWDKKEDPRSLAAEGIEVWANAHGYLVSNLGQVFNPETGVLLSGHLGPKGYVSVGGRHVHRLVCSAFCGPSSHVVDHIDGNHSNNRLSNLEYVTREENSRRAVNNGQMRDRNGKVVHPLRADAAAILQKVLNGELSPKEAERLLGRSPVWIYAKVRALRWKGCTVPPLSFEDRRTAQSDAAEGKETYWRPWPRHPEYEVSNMGRVRSRESGKILSLSRAGTHPSALFAGPVYPAVMELYGPPKPFEGATIRHYPAPTGDSINNLQWGSYADQGKDSIEQGLIVRGEAHPRAKLSRDKIEAALLKFATSDMTITAFAKDIETDTRNALKVLKGRAWKHAIRSDGVAERLKSIGRIGGSHHMSTLSEARLIEALRIYTKEKKSGVWFAEYLGIALPTGHQILSGKTWAHVPRPTGFQYPWPDAARRFNKTKGSAHHAAKHTEEDIAHVFAQIMAGELNSQEAVGTALKMSKSNVALLLRGESWVNVPRPEGFAEKVASITRPVLSPETQAQIMKRLLAGASRKEIIAEFDISDSKASFYVTKANKQRRLGSNPVKRVH